VIQGPDEPEWSTQCYWQGRFVKEDTPWELNAPSSVLMEALDELTVAGFDVAGKRTLSPGCGRGSDALELVRRGAHVLAIDWSEVAVVSLRERHESIQLTLPGSLDVLHGDFFDIPARSVDIVCEHTFFCAIDPSMRPKYVEAMAAWVKPAGFLVANLFVVSNEEARQLPNRSLTKEGKGPAFASTVEELQGLFSAHFIIRTLRPGTQPDPGRRAGIEWVAVFERRSQAV
jgi:SAM-dependent methyltransferase